MKLRKNLFYLLIILISLIYITSCGDDSTNITKFSTPAITPTFTAVPATPTVTPTPDTGSIEIVIPWPTEKGQIIKIYRKN